MLYGANIDVISDDDNSNILQLSVNNNDMDTIKYILDYNKNHGNGLNINYQNKYGYSS